MEIVIQAHFLFHASCSEICISGESLSRKQMYLEKVTYAICKTWNALQCSGDCTSGNGSQLFTVHTVFLFSLTQSCNQLALKPLCRQIFCFMLAAAENLQSGKSVNH